MPMGNGGGAFVTKVSPQFFSPKTQLKNDLKIKVDLIALTHK